MAQSGIIYQGDWIGMVTGGNALLLNKTQIRMVEIIKEGTVRICMGLDPLQDIYIKLSDYTEQGTPEEVQALLSAIAAMLFQTNTEQNVT